MHIGGVAKKIGLTPDAIRFYKRTALLSRALDGTTNHPRRFVTAHSPRHPRPRKHFQ
jgi:DNA-binding transcriptional MerR regulator